MFGMGFTEILLIAVIAILFLGPDKLPGTMVEIAKFFRSVKNTVSSVKNSFEEELNVKAIKQEALAYKEELLRASENVHKARNIQANLDAEIENLINDDNTPAKAEEEPSVKQAPKESQEVTFKKKKKKTIEDKEENADV